MTIAGGATEGRWARRLGRRVRRLADFRAGRRSWIVIVFLALAGALTLAAARTWVLASQAPAWWGAAGIADEGSSQTRAEAVERGLSAALYNARPAASGPWTVELRAADANAWLRERLPRWLSNRGVNWPAGASPPRVLFGADAMTIALAVDTGAGQRIVGVRLQPRLEAGVLRAHVHEATVGRAVLPGSGPGAARWLSWLPGEWTKGEAGAWLSDILADKAPLLERTSIALDDGRVVEVVGLEIAEDRLRVTCRDSQTPPPD